MNGKQRCKILKQIRQQIAEANDIELVIAECTHKGDCRGTCPRCEAEVRYLERELEKRRQLQKRVALAGVCAGMTLALSGCAVIDQVIDNFSPTDQTTGMVPSDSMVEVLEGDMTAPTDLPEEDWLDGEEPNDPGDALESEPPIYTEIPMTTGMPEPTPEVMDGSGDGGRL